MKWRGVRPGKLTERTSLAEGRVGVAVRGRRGCPPRLPRADHPHGRRDRRRERQLYEGSRLPPDVPQPRARLVAPRIAP